MDGTSPIEQLKAHAASLLAAVVTDPVPLTVEERTALGLTTAECDPRMYPDDNPKTKFGVAKPAMSNVPPAALIQIMLAMADGKEKYGRANWRDKAVTASTYYDAACRHLFAWWDGEETADDSGVSHLGHAMACLAIIVDARSVDKCNDDRPLAGRFAALVKQFTKALTK